MSITSVHNVREFGCKACKQTLGRYEIRPLKRGAVRLKPVPNGLPVKLVPDAGPQPMVSLVLGPHARAPKPVHGPYFAAQNAIEVAGGTALLIRQYQWRCVDCDAMPEIRATVLGRRLREQPDGILYI